MYHFIKPFLDNKMSIFEGYGAFKGNLLFSSFFYNIVRNSNNNSNKKRTHMEREERFQNASESV